MKAILIAAMTVAPTAVHSQTVACTDATTHLEFQMTAPARWIRDSTLAIHPTPGVRNPENLVQFVVDTAGIPQPSTFKVLKASDSTLVVEARRTLGAWRFSPPMLNDCRVRQLVQTPIGR